MSVGNKRIALIAAALALLVSDGRAEAQTSDAASKPSVYADTSFSDVKSKVYLQVAPSQKLTFDAARVGARPLVLNGNDLELIADEVEVIGDVVIRAFRENDEGADNREKVGGAGRHGDTSQSNGCSGGRDGCTGPTGEQGGTGTAGGDGKPAGFLQLKIQKLTGTGTLTIMNIGQTGGRGARGGRGGNGGRGGPGMGAACPDLWGRHGEDAGKGGPGGTGGTGGTGGAGGKGGSGGRITYTSAMEQAILLGQLVLRAEGGPGGEPGTGGDAGAPGGGGPKGDGKGECFKQPGEDGPGGRPGAAGSSGAKGAEGPRGLAACEGNGCPAKPAE